MRLLIIENEHRLSDTLKKGFTEEGYAIDQTFDGEEGLYLAESENYDAIILDWMLPKIDGLTVCSSLRQKHITTPIIMLTAKTRIEDIVEGLDAGADDYLAKPFAFAELKSRLRALQRRQHSQTEPFLSVADLVLDPKRHMVKRGGKEIMLTPKEFAILEYLMQHKDGVVTRVQITEHIWDYNFDSLSNVVDVFMAALRKKVDGGNLCKLIQTVHGVGYRISSEGK